MTEWLLTYFIHSSVLLLFVAVLVRCTRNETALERLWRIALAGPLVSTTLLLATPVWLSFLVPHEGTGGGGSPQILLGPGDGNWTTSRLVGVGLTIWATIALLGLAHLLLGHLKLARLLRGRISLFPSTRPRVFVVSGLRTPLALLSGDLCLPPSALRDLSAEELAAVLAHEQEHVRRRDPCWLLFQSVMCRVFFFQPLNWVAARRLRGLAEFICDASAAKRTSPVAVASALATVSTWMGREPLAAAGMASGESLTLTRVRRILTGEAGRTPKGRMAPVAGAFLLGLSMLGPAVTVEGGGPAVPYTIAAYDDGGPFTVSIERGKVTGMTFNGIPVPPSAIDQRGNQVRVAASGRTPLLLTLTESGGMRWTSRPRALAGN